MTRSVPKQRPHTSEQTVETPDDFMAAVIQRFGVIDVDLACDRENSKGGHAHTEDLDGVQGWDAYTFGTLWLNPPFNSITEFAERAVAHARKWPSVRILMLVPASVGANWFREHVHGRAYVLALSPRLKFVGHASSFPKDLMLCVYDGARMPGFDCWKWK